jgi:hypothetical protein
MLGESLPPWANPSLALINFYFSLFPAMPIRSKRPGEPPPSKKHYIVAEQLSNY